ncbi:hypothetical protein ACGF07_28210 [Kitasatospora sp. NPDC048194]|uniref:hypothetical protein n=1 Tax=Kitasatospora sp. NPDC048194 TaxID=3364045 RepID=UPI003710C5E3
MGERHRWSGPSYFDGTPKTFGDGLELAPAVQALREAVHRLRELVPRPPGDPAEELLDALSRLAAIEKAVASERVLLLAEANYRGATWQQMAQACRVRRQSLHKRYADRVLRVIGICSDANPEKPLRLIMELYPNTFNHLVALGLVNPEPSTADGRHRLAFRRHTHAIAVARQQNVPETESDKSRDDPRRHPTQG